MTSPETEGAYGEQATANLAAFVNKFTGTVDAITTQYADTLATAHELLNEFGEEIGGITDLFIGVWFCRLMCLVTTLQIATEDNLNFKLKLEVKRKKEAAEAERLLARRSSLMSISESGSISSGLGDGDGDNRASEFGRRATLSRELSSANAKGGNEPMGLMDSLLSQARNQSLRKSTSMFGESEGDFTDTTAKGRVSSIRRGVSGEGGSDEESESSESDGWHSDGSGSD